MQYVPKMLANSRDQLGEQMQIHELTRPRKVNEASVAGALGGAGAALSGIANQIGKQAMTKVLGTDTTAQYGDTQNREQGFQNMANSSAAKTLATTMQTAWQQTVQNFMANSKDSNGNPPTGLDQVTQPSIATLKANLEDLVNRMIGRNGADYKNLATMVGNPQQKLYTEKIIADIDKSVDAIYNATIQKTDPKAVGNLFTQLVGQGVLPAQNILSYDTGRRGVGGAGVVTGLSTQTQQLANAAKFDNAEIVSLQQAIKRNNITSANDPRIAELLGLQQAAE